MVKRNINFAKLHAGYLFPEITKRKNAYLKQYPEKKLISLGIGDTTLPLPATIVDAFTKYANDLGDSERYTGYGPDQGSFELRQLLAEKLCHGKIDASEIFLSDGAKCDLGRLQYLFGANVNVAIPNPSYPVYVDGSVIAGTSLEYEKDTHTYGGLTLLSCTPGNHFFPDLSGLKDIDIIYFCSPNNPTGAVATHRQLQELIDWAKKNQAIILFDAAYSAYIRDETLPKSIYEIPGAKDVAIEINSFSKLAGFTGVRLGWTIVPHQLFYEDGTSVHQDFLRLMSTLFNGPSNLSQCGGIAALSPQGLIEIKETIDYYLENAKILKTALESVGVEVYGGDHAPYLWVHFPAMKSWDVFQYLLEECGVITTPGVGFGSAGEHFIRLTSFGKRHSVLAAAEALKACLKGVL